MINYWSGVNLIESPGGRYLPPSFIHSLLLLLLLMIGRPARRNSGQLHLRPDVCGEGVQAVDPPGHLKHHLGHGALHSRQSVVRQRYVPSCPVIADLVVLCFEMPLG